MTTTAPTLSDSPYPLGKVTVIGGCGFLGHHVVAQLLSPRYSVPVGGISVIDVRCTRNRRPAADQVTYHEVDITDAARLAAILAANAPDVVIHTASPAAQGSDRVAHDLFRKVNVEGTRAVIAGCQEAGVKALVYTSSASVISDNQSNLVHVDERWPMIRGREQTEYYSETKAEAESLVLAANTPDTQCGLKTVAIRPAGIMGEGDNQLLPNLINIHRTGRTKVQVGDNNNLFDFTYVGNVAHAHLLAARALLHTHAVSGLSRGGVGIPPLEHERVAGEAFLITNDEPVYFWDFCRAVWAAAGAQQGPGEAWVLSRGLGMLLGWVSEVVCAAVGRPATFNRQRIVYSCMTRYYCIDKAKRRLGYRPLVGLSEAVGRSVRWFLEQEKKG